MNLLIRIMIDYVMEIFGTKRREPLTGHSIGRIFFTSPSEQEGVPGLPVT